MSSGVTVTRVPIAIPLGSAPCGRCAGSGAAAFAAAKATEPDEAHLPNGKDPSGIATGNRVTVTPDDNARVPVTGTLVAADAQEVVVATDRPETGTLHVHFPRAGFDTLPA